MELKVWVEGIQRIICGVTDATTCQDVVFALAHATGKTGRFTLIERWRNNERLLAPNESPLKILTKLGEYSSEVQFILQKSEKPSQSVNTKQESKSGDLESLEKLADLRQSNSLLEKQAENVGIVKGIPQKPIELAPSITKAVLSIRSDCNSSQLDMTKDRKATFAHFQSDNISENLLDLYNQRLNNSNNSNSSSSPVTSNGVLKPPAYRNPPTPKASMQSQKLIDMSNGNFSPIFPPNDIPMQNVPYRDLVQLIKYQRDKISTQQNDLTKFDAEIVYLESKGREQIQHLEAISQELSKTDQVFRQGNEQLVTLQYVEEENDLVFQQEKTLKSEIALLRSKLGILETELLQCRNKIKKLMDEIQIEQRNQNQQQENRQQLEHRLMSEVDRLQADIDYAIHTSDNTMKTADGLKKEVLHIEISIVEKKKQLEKLVQEMKEVNLQSLTVSTDDIPMGEGSSKTGRRIIGSPRQLENAVATSKNPHGVWV